MKLFTRRMFFLVGMSFLLAAGGCSVVASIVFAPGYLRPEAPLGKLLLSRGIVLSPAAEEAISLYVVFSYMGAGLAYLVTVAYGLFCLNKINTSQGLRFMSAVDTALFALTLPTLAFGYVFIMFILSVAFAALGIVPLH